ncbi:Clavaminate synthase-like protein [Panus rudis PR-1116 ss-1]|nr:Clavaminate synthase-like protein [Panus rudis PR-1116 ss-1]
MAEFPTLDRLDPTIQAEELFSYISSRKPAIIKGLPDDESFKAGKWTDLKYLIQKAGETKVLVEPIHPKSQQYGTDVERISMPFKDFLSSLTSSDGPHHYLTTQYAELEKNPDSNLDQFTVLPSPANALADDFPEVPRIMGNLFLQQVNLWIGKSKDGSSSGLHHDFHDNLYCLLKGKKRFVLYPPQELENLYPYGDLDTLHPNGLISYKDARVRSDGLPLKLALRARLSAIERKLDALPKQNGSADVKGQGKGKEKKAGRSKERRALEKLHDETLDEIAQLALEDEAEFGADEEVDDFDALMAGLDGMDQDGDDDFALAGPSNGGDLQDDVDDQSEEDDEGEGLGLPADNNGDEDASDNDSEENTEPSSFSRIPTAFLHQHLDLPTTAVPPPSLSPSSPTTFFPNLRKASKPYVVELNAGEMLYLPASWWHEVTSFSSPAGENGKDPDVHMAFNYWFYPPNAKTFEQPYEDTLVWEFLRSQRDRDAAKKTGKVTENETENGTKKEHSKRKKGDRSQYQENSNKKKARR